MKKILLVDDDISFKTSLKDCLELEGYDVCCADDGKQGLSLFKQENPNLVITDIIMPETDGLEFILLLKELSQQEIIKIIAISGGGRIAGKDYLATAKVLGANNTFEKPFDLDNLLVCIKQLLPVEQAT